MQGEPKLSNDRHLSVKLHQNSDMPTEVRIITLIIIHTTNKHTQNL